MESKDILLLNGALWLSYNGEYVELKRAINGKWITMSKQKVVDGKFSHIIGRGDLVKPIFK